MLLLIGKVGMLWNCFFDQLEFMRVYNRLSVSPILLDILREFEGRVQCLLDSSHYLPYLKKIVFE